MYYTEVVPLRPQTPIYFSGGSTFKEGRNNPFLDLKWSDLGPPISGQVHWGSHGCEKAFPPTLEAVRDHMKKPISAKISKNDNRSTFRGNLFLGRSIFRERCVRKLPMLQNSPDSARKRVFNRHAVRHVRKLPNLQNFPESSCPVGLRQCCRQTTWRPKREISILIVLSSTTDHPQSVKIFQSLVFW